MHPLSIIAAKHLRLHTDWHTDRLTFAWCGRHDLQMTSVSDSVQLPMTLELVPTTESLAARSPSVQFTPAVRLKWRRCCSWRCAGSCRSWESVYATESLPRCGSWLYERLLALLAKEFVLVGGASAPAAQGYSHWTAHEMLVCVL